MFSTSMSACTVSPEARSIQYVQDEWRARDEPLSSYVPLIFTVSTSETFSNPITSYAAWPALAPVDASPATSYVHLSPTPVGLSVKIGVVATYILTWNLFC